MLILRYDDECFRLNPVLVFLMVDIEYEYITFTICIYTEFH